MKMGQLIQIEPDVWRTLVGLRKNVKFYTKNNIDGRYDDGLRKEKDLLAYYFTEEMGKVYHA